MEPLQAKVASILDFSARVAEACFMMNLACVSDLSESTIEKLLAGALVAKAGAYFQPGELDFVSGQDQTDAVNYLRGQSRIGPYRADFELVCRRSQTEQFSIIIECDGHEFHEKTKQQAARDKKRDRFFAAAGYTVLRFTGSEIWRDPLGCANEVYATSVQLDKRKQRTTPQEAVAS